MICYDGFIQFFAFSVNLQYLHHKQKFRKINKEYLR